MNLDVTPYGIYIGVICITKQTKYKNKEQIFTFNYIKCSNNKNKIVDTKYIAHDAFLE